MSLQLPMPGYQTIKHYFHRSLHKTGGRRQNCRDLGHASQLAGTERREVRALQGSFRRYQARGWLEHSTAWGREQACYEQQQQLLPRARSEKTVLLAWPGKQGSGRRADSPARQRKALLPPPQAALLPQPPPASSHLQRPPSLPHTLASRDRPACGQARRTGSGSTSPPRSNTAAAPMPDPMHMDTTPKRAPLPRRCIS